MWSTVVPADGAHASDTTGDIATAVAGQCALVAAGLATGVRESAPPGASTTTVNSRAFFRVAQSHPLVATGVVTEIRDVTTPDAPAAAAAKSRAFWRAFHCLRYR